MIKIKNNTILKQGLRINKRKYKKMFNILTEDERTNFISILEDRDRHFYSARAYIKSKIKNPHLQYKESLTRYLETTDLTSIKYEERLALAIGLKLLSKTGQLNITRFLEDNSYSFSYVNSVINNYFNSAYYFTKEEIVNALKNLFP